MVVNVKWVENDRFQAEARGHKLVADQPLNQGGDDQGMTPIELFAASIGSCVGYYSALFCRRHKISIDGMKIDVEWKSAENPHRIGELKVSITLPRDIGERERVGLMKYADACTIHNTLKHPPKIDLNLSFKS